MEFKEKIKTARLKAGYTLEELAKKVGVSTATISRYESGDILNVRRDKISKLADALNVTPGYLMDWEADPTGVTKAEYSVSGDHALELLMNDLKGRESMTQLFIQMKDMDEQSIRKIIKVIKSLEDGTI